MNDQEFLVWIKEDPDDTVSLAELAVSEIDNTASPIRKAAETLLDAYDYFNEITERE